MSKGIFGHGFFFSLEKYEIKRSKKVLYYISLIVNLSIIWLEIKWGALVAQYILICVVLVKVLVIDFTYDLNYPFK